jgi:hypothetical protein
VKLCCKRYVYYVYNFKHCYSKNIISTVAKIITFITFESNPLWPSWAAASALGLRASAALSLPPSGPQCMRTWKAPNSALTQRPTERKFARWGSFTSIFAIIGTVIAKILNAHSKCWRLSVRLHCSEWTSSITLRTSKWDWRSVLRSLPSQANCSFSLRSPSNTALMYQHRSFCWLFSYQSTDSDFPFTCTLPNPSLCSSTYTLTRFEFH